MQIASDLAAMGARGRTRSVRHAILRRPVRRRGRRAVGGKALDGQALQRAPGRPRRSAAPRAAPRGPAPRPGQAAPLQADTEPRRPGPRARRAGRDPPEGRARRRGRGRPRRARATSSTARSTCSRPIPGGAFADPRVAEAYRRTLDTVQVREIELARRGRGRASAAAEPASIDAVARAAGERRAGQRRDDGAGRRGRRVGDDRPAGRAQRRRALVHRPLPGAAARLVRGGALARPAVPARRSARSSPRKASRRTSPTSRWWRAPSRPSAYSRAKAKGVWQFITRDRQALRPRRRLVGGRAERPREGHPRGRPLPEGPLRACSATGTWRSPATTRARARCCAASRATARRTTGSCARRGRCGRETKNYVPLIHAAIVVAKAPERYGFAVTPDALPDFERVPGRRRLRPARDRRVRGRARRDAARAQPRAAPARDAGRPRLRPARAAGPRRDAAPVPGRPAAREAGRASARTWCGAGRRSRRSRARTASRPRRSPRPTPARAPAPAAPGHRADHPDPAPGRPTWWPRAARPREAAPRRGATHERYRIQPGDTLGSIAAAVTAHGARAPGLERPPRHAHRGRRRSSRSTPTPARLRRSSPGRRERTSRGPPAA